MFHYDTLESWKLDPLLSFPDFDLIRSVVLMLYQFWHHANRIYRETRVL